MKKIVYRKIAEECIKFFLLSIFAISIIIWVLQAVNYLDFVIQDGHGFIVYFNYTLLSFPKIFSRIFPFAIFLAFSYILLKYENKNELVIFWNFGVKKINFINYFIKFSFLFVLLSILLNAFIAPLAQNKAKSFIRSSNLGFFESSLKPKKFIDIIRNLTIYFDKKTENGEFKNIFLTDKSNKNEYQITFAKTGKLQLRDNKKILILRDGKTINNRNGKISEFEFSKSDFNITRFGTGSMNYQKTQENSSAELIKCLLALNDIEKIKLKKIDNCRIENLEKIYEEIYVRLIKPFYIILLITISLLFILKSKEDHNFKLYTLKVYSLGFLLIIFSETSTKFIGVNNLQNLFISLLPLIFVFLIYIYFLQILKVKKL